jgi:hypothetical protein
MLMTGIFTEYTLNVRLNFAQANIFCSSAVAALDGQILPGGALNGNGWQIA